MYDPSRDLKLSFLDKVSMSKSCDVFEPFVFNIGSVVKDAGT